MIQHSSSSPTPVIAVFDIGKTNKKIFLFNEDYKIVYERTAHLPEAVDEDGFPCENVNSLTKWVSEEIKLVRAHEHINIKSINVSAYGASFVHLDEQGKPIGHLYNYLKPFPEKLLRSFISHYDQDDSLSLQTSSPQLGNLNSALQLFFLKHEKSSFYNQIKYSLHLSQFISFLLTGKTFTELTSIGCHTMLWDFKRNNYHKWVKQEGIDSKFPELVNSDHVVTSNETKIGIGLHDSSAALIPYLKSFVDPFVLISTGTWCISLNPFNQSELTQKELELDCLQYLSYEGKPVKASRLFAGHEHELMIQKIASHFGVKAEKLHSIEFDQTIAAKLINTSKDFKTENKLGQHPSDFGKRNLSDFKSPVEAYHQLVIDLVRQQIKSTSLILKNIVVKNIFVDGGFSNNSVYMNLLAAGFPEYKIFGASIPQASALGAALIIHRAWNTHDIPNEIIKLRVCKRPDDIEIHPVV
ncbi:MAG TPA: FGGY family carbohydrate kinase [Cyclobacteriaceae bacterium]|jgi:sugar (pentulose or hexulose) kinase|nr:FGGY family carbohydrate kinase [Cyclobacteriaceae bacterium]